VQGRASAQVRARKTSGCFAALERNKRLCARGVFDMVDVFDVIDVFVV